MNKANIYRYLRISGEPDAGTDARIDDCMALAHKLIHAERIYRIYDVQPAENGILLGDTFFEGEKIRDRLAACVRCAVFAVTLGAQSDQLLRKYAVTDPARSVIMQAVLADYTEDFCDLTEADIQSSAPELTLCKRFSPGYPGLPLSYQKQIFSMMDITKRIGIFLTDSYFMIPSKSVTAFVGLKKGDA